MPQIQSLLHISHEDINGDGDPYLSFDCILFGSVKGLDSEVLLDPFEEQFYLPAAAIKIGNRDGRQNEILIMLDCMIESGYHNIKSSYQKGGPS